MKKTNPKIAAMVGTALEYYDMSLYGMMLPILINIFLPNLEKIQALMLSSVLLPLSMLSRPLGAIILGRIGDQMGRKNALIISITGMAIVTGLTALIPSYESIGVFAPIIFIIFRVFQSFFVAGEYNGGAIFVLEHSRREQRGYISGLYCFYTVIGISSAALVTSIISYFPDEYWRVPYLLGSLIGFFGIYLRKNIEETPEFIAAKKVHAVPLMEIAKKWKIIFLSIFVASFFSMLYVLPTIFMNSFIPLVTQYKTSTILTVNSFTTFIYMISLPIMGKFADKLTISRSMKFAAISVILLCYPLLSLIKFNDLKYIILMKTCFALLTAWYVGPFHAWIQDSYTTKERYTAISFCYSIGSQLGNLIMPLGLFLWQSTESYLALSTPIIFFAVAALFALQIVSKRDVK